MNDLHPVVVARNLLLLSLLLSEGKEVLDTIIAIWYSVAMSHVQYMNVGTFVSEQLLPLAERQKEDKIQLQYGLSTIELNGVKDAFTTIGLMMKNNLKLQAALDARNAVMVNPSRKDYTDRHLVGLQVEFLLAQFS